MYGIVRYGFLTEQGSHYIFLKSPRMAQVERQRHAHVKARFGRWLRATLGEAAMTQTALAVEYLRYKSIRDGERDISKSELRDSAPRDMVKQWLRDSYATAESAFIAGQVIGAKLESVDGLRALYACGHYDEFVSLSLSLADIALETLSKGTHTIKEIVAAQDALNFSLSSLSAMPLVFAEFDGVGLVDATLAEPVNAVIAIAATRDKERDVFLASLEFAWNVRADRTRRWLSPGLFAWARAQSGDYRGSSLLAWGAIVDAMSFTAYTRLQNNERDLLHEYWTDRAEWFHLYRRALWAGKRVSRADVLVSK